MKTFYGPVTPEVYNDGTSFNEIDIHHNLDSEQIVSAQVWQIRDGDKVNVVCPVVVTGPNTVRLIFSSGLFGPDKQTYEVGICAHA